MPTSESQASSSVQVVCVGRVWASQAVAQSRPWPVRCTYNRGFCWCTGRTSKVPDVPSSVGIQNRPVLSA